jgi:STIP1 family protein 1
MWSSRSASSSVGEADSLKAQGNECFRKGKLNAAIECYTQAIFAHASAALYSNRAMCRVKRCLTEDGTAVAVAEWKQVESDCLDALRLEPEGKTAFKCLYNLGLARTELGHYKAAAENFSQARKRWPEGDATKAIKLQRAEDALRKKEWESTELWRSLRRQRTLAALKALVDVRASTAAAAAAAAAPGGGHGGGHGGGDGSTTEVEDAAVEPAAVEQQEEEEEAAEDWAEHAVELAQMTREEEARAKRDIPDWLCCKISWDLARDPVHGGVSILCAVPF